MTNFTIIKEQNNFRLEAYPQHNSKTDYYITNPIKKTWSISIRCKDDAFTKFKEVVERDYI